ncbi:hypothetical protein HPB48_026984 [Haemaphysalis longicornis]|uniref:THAP-type domain-containing protein n=1 Tax=Haemaphysalis longicornis TaxID=44386 RepID=A0A9J6HD87_HAELO|nr:hypothetical protein HPB48_026984 [Haemaphysalis longicornis]
MSKPKLQWKERTCFVPLCKSGHRSNKERVSMFSAPSDAMRLEKWERSINTKDRRLTTAAVVCERHFEKSCIERTFSIIVNGVTNENSRDKARPKPDAIPTTFPDDRKHIVPKVTAKGKNRILDEQESPEKRRKHAPSKVSEFGSGIESAESVDLEGFGANTGAPETQNCNPRCGSEELSTNTSQKNAAKRLPTTSLHPFSRISIPVTWMKVPSVPVESLDYAYCEDKEHNFANLFIEKMVVFGKP